MKVLLVTHGATVSATEVAGLVADEFREAGATVEMCGTESSDDTLQMSLRRVAAHVDGSDLVVYATDEVTIADAGGPWLRQVATWAGRVLAPVVVVAPTCAVSTRELRTIGVEAGYQVVDRDQARRVVRTWMPSTPAKLM